MTKKDRTGISDKKSQRIESKKRKIEAFLSLVKNTATTDGKRRLDNPVIDTRKRETKMDENPVKRQKVDPDEVKALQAEVRASIKTSMEKPKLFLTLNNLVVNQFSPNRSFNVIPSLLRDVEYSPVLMVEVLHLVLYALQKQASTFRPRWCKLLRMNKISQVVCVVIDNVGATEWMENEHAYLPALRDNFTTNIEVVSPSYYGHSTLNELLNVPLTEVEKKHFLQHDKVKVDRPPEAKDSEKVATESWVPGQDFRLDLMLNPIQLAGEGFPIPVKKSCQGYVFTKDHYDPVTSKSPLYGLDCEMCATKIGNEVTSVALVNEDGQVVFDTLVRPYNPILNYLTEYSGITKAMLRSVQTRLDDVQTKIREILPADAIICGHSVSNDLRCLRMFHPYIIDTSVIYSLSHNVALKTGLKRLTEHFLGKQIQMASGHDAAEDALASLELVKLKLSMSPTYGDLKCGGSICPPSNLNPDAPEFTPSNSPRTSWSADSPAANQLSASNSANQHEASSSVDHSSTNQNKASPSGDHSSTNQNQNNSAGDQSSANQHEASSSVDHSSTNQNQASSSGDHSSTNGSTGCLDKVSPVKRRLELSDSDSSDVDDSDALDDVKVPPTEEQNNLAMFLDAKSTHKSKNLLTLLEGHQCHTAVIADSDAEGLYQELGHSRYVTYIPYTGDKASCREFRRALADNHFVLAELKSFNPYQPEAGKQRQLQRLNKRISKILVALPPNALAIVVLSGRTDPLTSHNAVCFTKIT